MTSATAEKPSVEQGVRICLLSRWSQVRVLRDAATRRSGRRQRFRVLLGAPLPSDSLRTRLTSSKFAWVRDRTNPLRLHPQCLVNTATHLASASIESVHSGPQ